MGRKYIATIPIPPSVNDAYVNVPKVGRVKSARYKTWEKKLKPNILPTPTQELQEEIVASFGYGRPDRRKRDVDNYAKCVLDALTKFRVIKDDSQIVDLRLYWSPDVEAGMVRVELEELM